MGDRISIQFKNKSGMKSAVLCSHWDGEQLLEFVSNYLEELKHERRDNMYPIDRLEAPTVMADFIRYLTLDIERINSNYYIVSTPEECDNSDNGHYIIDPETELVKREE
jgi:hypothetical protein